MLHAGAANPWPDVEPGMSFGIWGTHFVPGQTWWKAGGAKELFGYMARCQALLQQGLPAMEQLPPVDGFLTYRRTDGDMDIIFVCNQTGTTATGVIPFDHADRNVEIWDPYTLERFSMPETDSMQVTIEPYGSRFLIIRPGESKLPALQEMSAIASVPISGEWTVTFPGTEAIRTHDLFSWPESDNPDIRYFSGTALYSTTFTAPDDALISSANVILSLGEVRDMAKITVNGEPLPIAWKAPYECDITEAIIPGTNTLEIEKSRLARKRHPTSLFRTQDCRMFQILHCRLSPPTVRSPRPSGINHHGTRLFHLELP